MKGVSAVTADRNNGCDRASQVEEDAGIRPFLEPRITRRQDGNGSQHLPKSQDGEEVQRIAKDRNDAVRVGAILPHLRDAAASDEKRYQYGRRPISYVFAFVVIPTPSYKRGAAMA